MTIRLIPGDCRDVLKQLESASVHCCITSPPYYGLRDYGTAQWDGGDAGCDHIDLAGSGTRRDADRERPTAGPLRGGSANPAVAYYRDICGKCGARRIDRQIGLEATPEAYLQTMVEVFREIRRVLRDDGCVFCNMGDGYQDKQLLMMPARLALALQQDGWWLRSQIVWHKPGPMPESVRDRPTSAYEMVYLLTKKPRYYFDLEAIRTESGANSRNVWTIASYPFSEWGETVRQVRVAWDAGVDGMKRKASPDCPVHADRPVRDASARGGERVSDHFDHTGRSDIRLAPSQPIDYAPIAQLRERETEAQSSDLLGLLHAPSATGHSSQSHRTALDPSTSPACSVSVQMADDTGRISASPSLFGSAGHTLGSNSEQDGSDDRPSAQTGDHSADMSSCSCEWYIEKTEKTSHFATFPPELAERCIRAGTSERGCCAQCGTPWVRVVETHYTPGGPKHSGNAKALRYIRDGEREDSGYKTRHDTTTGWQPGCTHGADVVPCTVLDPFAGAGTTLLVADRLQRNAVGIELNAAYTEMAMERVKRDAPLFADLHPPPAARRRPGRRADA